MVVISPRSRPKFSISTLATGARQLVVQEALEMMVCFAGSYFSWLIRTTSKVVPRLIAARRMLRPILPKPLMAKRAMCLCLLGGGTHRLGTADRQGTAPAAESSSGPQGRATRLPFAPLEDPA